MHGDLILALDPGTRHLGAAVWMRQQLVEAREFKSSKPDRLERSHRILEDLAGWVEGINCQAIAYGWWDLVYEAPAYFTPREHGQARPIQALERLVGMLEHWGLSQGMGVFGYNVATVKTGVIGRANATKAEVEVIMRNEYNLHDRQYPSHLWDAMAVGTYHLSRLRIRDAIRR